MNASTTSPDLFKANPREPIPGYILRERIGTGGFGEVWKADAPGGLQKAVKIVFGDLSDARAARELKALERVRSVHHPMLLSLERIEAVDDHLVIVTELADMSLRDCYDQRREQGRPGIPREELLGYLRDAADGLDFLYEKHSLQHLDVKPENLLLVGGRVKVADFGLIKDLHDKSVSIVGGLTPLYAAPELFEGRPNRHSDQYSLAVLYQELLTGTPPFEGRTPAQIAIQQLQGSPVLSPLPRLDQSIIARALSKNPGQRFPSCRILIDQLFEAGQGGSPQPRPASSLTRTPTTTGGAERSRDTVCVAGIAVDTTPLPMVHPSETVLQPPLALEQKTPTLRPLLMVGLGGAANKLLAQVKQRIDDRFGDAGRLPSMGFLAIDTDAEELDHASQGMVLDWGVGGSVLTPLRCATEYREYREPLLEWISRRWLYNIPRSLKTEGIRPLGRLAFVDHFAEVKRAIGRSLRTVMEDESLEATSQATGWTIDADHLDVVLIGHVGGGTASGALVDLAFTLRTELRKRSLPDTIRLLLLHSTSRRSSARDLAIANTIVFLREFHEIAGPRGRYPGEPTCGIPAYEHHSAQFPDTTIVHLGDELDDQEFLHRLSRLGDYLYRETVAPSAETLRAYRHTTMSKVPPRFGSLTTLGLSSAEGLMGQLPAQICCILLDQLVARWSAPQTLTLAGPELHLKELDQILSSPNPKQHSDATDHAASNVLKSLQLGDSELREAVHRLVAPSLGMSPSSYWQNFFGRVLDDDGFPHPGIHVDDSIRTIIGRVEGNTAISNVVPLRRHLEQSGTTFAVQRAASLIGCLRTVMDAPGERVQTALSLACRFAALLNEMSVQIQTEMNADTEQLGELLPVATLRGDGGRRSQAQVAAENRRQTWTRIAELHQAWAERSTIQFILRTILSAVNDEQQRLAELARGLRRLYPSATGDTLRHHEDPSVRELFGWVQSRARDWVAEMDRICNEKLETLGFPFSALLDRHHAGWEIVPDLLRETAHRLVASAIMMRSLEHAGNDPDDADSPSTAISRLLDEARPDLAACGGQQQWLLFSAPDESALRNALQQRLTAQTGHPGTEIQDASGTLLVCCRMTEVPIENCIAHLVGSRRDLVQLAERLHTRLDINWPPVV